MKVRLVALVCVGACTAFAAFSHAFANDLLSELTDSGVVISARETTRLPAPTLADGLSGPEQRTRIEKAVDGKHPWAEFTRKSVVAPFLLKISDAGDEARRLDVWFFVHGDLQKIQSDEFLNERIRGADGEDANGGSQVRTLTEADLRKRNLPLPTAASDPRYVASDLTLFEKVRVQSVTRNAKTSTRESVTIASVLDPTFNGDRDFPNQWRALLRDESGRKSTGDPQPYSGLASYIRATRSAEIEGAIFVEYHAVFAEPKGWFNGANLLRSKLPLVTQDAVRRFRRSLDAR